MGSINSDQKARKGNQQRKQRILLVLQGKISSPSASPRPTSLNHVSFLLFTSQNNIPVFCPALTDGSLGDMLYFHSYKAEAPLVIDIVSDIRRLNDMSVKSKRAGMIILGGGVCKHQIANAMLFVSRCRSFLCAVTLFLLLILSQQRNGADYAVYVNTGQEYDGSDSGARPDEAVSWGKIKAGARAVKVRFLLIFPEPVSSTFIYLFHLGLCRCYPGVPIVGCADFRQIEMGGG